MVRNERITVGPIYRNWACLRLCSKQHQLSSFTRFLLNLYTITKFWRITQPCFATQKKTRYSAITQVGIPSRIGGYNERVRTGLCSSGMAASVEIYCLRPYGCANAHPDRLVFVLRLSTILGFHYRASTRLGLKTFKTRL